MDGRFEMDGRFDFRWTVELSFSSLQLVLEGGRATVTREVDGGLETMAADLPLIITTDLRSRAEPRPAYLTLSFALSLSLSLSLSRSLAFSLSPSPVPGPYSRFSPTTSTRLLVLRVEG